MASSSSRPTRDRKSIRPSLNENQLTLDASQHDEDAEEEYHVPKSRKSTSKRGVGAAADDDDDEADEGASKKRGGGGRPRKAAIAGATLGDVGTTAASTIGTTKKRTKASTAEELEIDKSELPSTIYQHLAHTRTSPTAIAHEILSQYAAADTNIPKRNRTMIGVINFILNSCGSMHQITADEFDTDPEEIVRDGSQVNLQSSLEPPHLRVKDFTTRWIEFWAKLTQEAHTSIHLSDDYLFPSIIIPWLRACSASPVRAWRQTTTIAAFSIVEQLNDIANELLKRVEVIEAQMKDPALKKGKKAKELPNALDSANQQIDTVHSLLSMVFKEIFIHRFRDVNPELRLLCVQQLGSWLLSYPQYWITEQHTKYIGWTLSDKSAEVRLASVEAIIGLVSTEDAYILESSAAFVAYFAARLYAMVQDSDEAVAAAAIDFTSYQLKLNRLTERDGDIVPRLLWDASSDIRDKAAEFTIADTFADRTDDPQEDITQIINLIDSHCLITESTKKKDSADRRQKVSNDTIQQGYSTTVAMPMDMLVNSFWNKLDSIKDYAACTKLMVALTKPTTSERGMGSRKKSAPIDEDRQLMLCHFLNSVSKRACGYMNEANVPNLTNTKKKAEREELLEEAQKFSSHFITVAAELLTLHGADAQKLGILLSIIPRIDLTLFGALRKRTEFSSLLTRIKQIYMKHSKLAVLEQAAAAIRHLTETEHQFKDQAVTMATEIATELASDWDASYARVHGTQVDVEMDSEERLSTMLTTLHRMTCLQRAVRLPQLNWDAIPSLEKSLTYYAINHGEPLEQEILIALMHLGFTTLAWNYRTLQSELREDDEEEENEENENEEEEEKKGGDEDEEMKDGDEEEEKSPSKKKKGASKKKKKSPTKKRESKKKAASPTRKVNAKLLDATARLSKEYLGRLELALGFESNEAYQVKDTIYRILSDCFVLFSGKLIGTPLASLVIGPDRLSTLQFAFNQYLQNLLNGTDMKYRVQADITSKKRAAYQADLQLLAVKDAIKPALYDMNSLPSKEQLRTTLRHRQLAGMLLARYGNLGDEIDALLKQFMISLRSISNNTLLQAQFEALQICYTDELDDETLKKLSTSFVLVFPINPAQRSFTGLLRHGLLFGLSHPPKNLSFLDLLVPFIQRASIDDLKQTALMFANFGTRVLTGFEPEQRQAEEAWESIQTLADAINKKFGALVMEVKDRAVVINTKGAKAVPGTPVVGNTPARRGRKSAAVTGELTPMSSPAPRSGKGRTPKSSRSHTSRMSEQLGTVEEEEDEQVATAKAKAKRASAPSKKRGRAAEAEEEEEEEKKGEEEEEEPAEEEDEDAMETDDEPKSKSKAKGKGKGKPKAAAAEAPRRSRKRAAEDE